MEFIAVAKSGVHVYAFRPEDGVTLQDQPQVTFPRVPNADSVAWSPDGALLGRVDPASGGVAVHNASVAECAQLCEVPPLIGGPVRCFYFSPLGNHLVTYERWLKDAGNNVGLWDARTGELRWSFMLKKLTEMNWPPIKWNALETHCCRMVADGVQIMPGNAQREESVSRVEAPGIMAFEVSPKGAGGSPGHVAVCVPESKGAPGRCQLFSLDEPSKPTASKSFYKAQKVQMRWNNTGTAILVQTMMDVDDSGKAYYGTTKLYHMRPDGQEDSIVAGDDGAVHDVQWSPTQDEFLLLHGDLPCKQTLHEGRKARTLVDFGRGHHNTIRWNNFGRFVVLGGFGQLVGDTEFWDKPGKQLLGSVRLECCVVSEWGPDGRYFLSATTAPRMRVDNKIQIRDYCGRLLQTMEFEELLWAGWRPRSRGAFQDRPPSPGRGGAAEKPKAAAPAAAKAYRPPGARGAGGGGLSEILRQELGSTSAEASTKATKVFGPSQPLPHCPPGMAPAEAAAASSSNRNARKKKAKEAAQAASQAVEKDALAAAIAPPSKAQEFSPPDRGANTRPADASSLSSAAAAAPAVATAEEATASAGVAAAASSAGGEVEKRVRALQKKLRDIKKLKERPAAELDVLQRQKLRQEADLLKQLQDLGFDE